MNEIKKFLDYQELTSNNMGDLGDATILSLTFLQNYTNDEAKNFLNELKNLNEEINEIKKISNDMITNLYQCLLPRLTDEELKIMMKQLDNIINKK